MKLKLTLTAPVPELADAFERHFARMKNVEIHRGPFETVPEFDAMVSAANSFGLMDGGVDLAITRYFGVQLMQRVQEHIIDHYRGEQPVGTAFTIHTGNKEHPWLIHAPTMRVPEITAGTDSTYRATWAALLAIHNHFINTGIPVNSVVFPGMGTGCGQVSPDSAAAQMALAWHRFNNPPESINWNIAHRRAVSVINAINGI